MSIQEGKIKTDELPSIKIFDIQSLNVFPCASSDQRRIFMPFLMRGTGGTMKGPASYTNELLYEIYQYDLATNTISRI